MRSRRVDHVFLLLIVALVIPACGPQSDAADPGSLQVDNLSDGRTSVTGFLVATNDEIRVCSVLLESHPPQCGGESLIVEELDLDSMRDLHQALGVVWSEGLVTLVGVLNGDVLTDAHWQN